MPDALGTVRVAVARVATTASGSVRVAVVRDPATALGVVRLAVVRDGVTSTGVVRMAIESSGKTAFGIVRVAVNSSPGKTATGSVKVRVLSQGNTIVGRARVKVDAYAGTGYRMSWVRRRHFLGAGEPPPPPPPPDTEPPTFSARSFWQLGLPPNTAKDVNSDAAVAELLRQRSVYGKALNVGAFVPRITYGIPSNQPLVPVKLMRKNWNGVVPGYAQLLADILWTGVPIPDDWAPQGDTDSSGGFMQSDMQWPDGKLLGRYYELWQVRRDWTVNPVSGWVAGWGGRMSGVRDNPDSGQQGNPGYFDTRKIGARYRGGNKLVAGDYYKLDDPAHPLSTYEDNGWGAAATSLPQPLTRLRGIDLARGEVNHMLGIGIPLPRNGEFYYPAQRTDGNTPTSAIREGMVFRLPPDYVVPSTLPLIAQLFVQGARDYGWIVKDKTTGAGSVAWQMDEEGLDYLGGLTKPEILANLPLDQLYVIQPGTLLIPFPTA